jgi:membrane protease YdiL (CAAX protease family)
MAQYDTQYTVLPEPQPPPAEVQPQRHWPLAAVFWLDLVIIFILIVLMNIGMVAFLLARASQAGVVDVSNPASMMRLFGDPATINRLLGPGLFVFLFLQNVIFAGVPIARIAWLRREPLAQIGFQARQPLRLIGLGLVAGIAILIVNAVIEALFSRVGIQQNQAEQFAEQFSLLQSGPAGQALFFVFGAIGAPFSEEVLFRGYAFNALRGGARSKRGGLIVAYLLSTLLFTLPHALGVTQGTIGLLVPLFLIGLALAWLMHRTGSLLPCVVAHAVNNSVGLLALLVCLNNPGISACPAF